MSELHEWVATVALVIGGALALVQYWMANRWKRSEFAAQQLDLLRTDPDLNLATRLLDWSDLKVEVPERYRAAFGKSTFRHSVPRTIAALMPESRKETFPWPEPIYRHVFDAFFQYLDRIGHYVDVHLLEPRDVDPLRYYLAQICRWRFGTGAQKAVFAEYVRAYGFPGVLRLARAFGMELPPGLDEQERGLIRLDAERVAVSERDEAA